MDMVHQPTPSLSAKDDQPTTGSTDESRGTADDGNVGDLEGISTNEQQQQQQQQQRQQQQQSRTHGKESQDVHTPEHGVISGVLLEDTGPIPEDDDEALSAAEQSTGTTPVVAKPSRLPRVGSEEPENDGESGGDNSLSPGTMLLGENSSSGDMPPEQQETAKPVAVVDVGVSSSTPSTASRVICLRALRDGDGGVGPAQNSVPAGAVPAAGTGGPVVAFTGNKVVDLREVKKVRQVVLTPTVRTLTPTPDVGDNTSEGEEEEEEEELAGGGSVKVDLAAGKRMIEFQLKVNAAEEKREAARIKSERERADAAIAQESQRMLDQVNARIEAQRRGRGLVSGSFGEGGRGGGGNGARAVAEAQIRILAERHGIRLQILNEEQACAVAQIHALAQEHGIRVQIIGDDSVVEGAIIDSNSGGGAGEVGGTGDFSAGRAEKGVRSTSAAAAVTPASGGATPPPLLYSLRLRPGSRPVSPSTASQTSLKPPARKTPTVPNSAAAKDGNVCHSGPARMMRMALQASGGCLPGGGRELSPVPNRTTGVISSSAGQKADGGHASGDARKTSATAEEATSAAAVCFGTRPTLNPPGTPASRTPPAAVTPISSTHDGSRDAAKDAIINEVGDAATNNNNNDNDISSRAVKGQSETTALLSGGRRKRDSISGSVSILNTDGGSTVHEDKRRKKNPDGSSSIGGDATGDEAMLTRVRPRRPANSMAGEGGRGGAGRSASATTDGTKSPVALPLTTSTAPLKRMRLVGPSGVVSQPNSEPSTPARPGRRGPANGGAGWTPGNNNLFKGAMAGIMGRGKRPAP